MENIGLSHELDPSSKTVFWLPVSVGGKERKLCIQQKNLGWSLSLANPSAKMELEKQTKFPNPKSKQKEMEFFPEFKLKDESDLNLIVCNEETTFVPTNIEGTDIDLITIQGASRKPIQFTEYDFLAAIACAQSSNYDKDDLQQQSFLLPLKDKDIPGKVHFLVIPSSVLTQSNARLRAVALSTIKKLFEFDSEVKPGRKKYAQAIYKELGSFLRKPKIDDLENQDRASLQKIAFSMAKAAEVYGPITDYLVKRDSPPTPKIKPVELPARKEDEPIQRYLQDEIYDKEKGIYEATLVFRSPHTKDIYIFNDYDVQVELNSQFPKEVSVSARIQIKCRSLEKGRDALTKHPVLDANITSLGTVINAIDEGSQVIIGQITVAAGQNGFESTKIGVNKRRGSFTLNTGLGTRYDAEIKVEKGRVYINGEESNRPNNLHLRS